MEEKNLRVSDINFDYLIDYIDYLSAILGRSELTVKEYKYDLINFFRYFLSLNFKNFKNYFNEIEINYLQNINLDNKNIEYTEIDIFNKINKDILNHIKLKDLYSYIAYLKRHKNASAANRARKIASLRSFFKYLHTKVQILDNNPAAELESPKLAKTKPRYLELDESIKLLSTKNNSKFSDRDFCILILFLNCGIRLSELCKLNLDDWQDNHLRVLGKGNKERMVYLNSACIEALNTYLKIRSENNSKDKKALFLSRQNNRLSKAAVQLLVKKYLSLAGLDSRKYSTHKLRHTAATLMYKYGQVDIRTLQALLGHASVSTTEIYTHLDNKILEDAVKNNPLAEVKRKD